MDSPVDNSDSLIQEFLENLSEVSETTKNDYHIKLRSLKRKLPLDGDEYMWVDHCKTVENPNTRSNIANVLIQLRSYHDLPCSQLQDLKDANKADIRQHRRMVAKKNLASMISYEDLLGEVDKLRRQPANL